jgi:hypothetical protein
MAPDDSTSFPFRSLPSEIRNKIYRELLCAFTPVPPVPNVIAAYYEPSLPRSTHVIDTAILRTSSTIYREGYDVLIKTNRFVKVMTARGIPLRPLLQSYLVPVVADCKRVVNAFKGYVLAVRLGCTTPLRLKTPKSTPGPWKEDWLEPKEWMILHRDLPDFCRALADADGDLQMGLTANLQLDIKMAPVLFAQPSSRHSPSFKNFFTDATQAALLAPFRSHLRGYTDVRVIGHVNKALAAATREELQQDRWSDPRTTLSDFAAAKEKGAELFRQRDLTKAHDVWQGVTLDIDKLRNSKTAWPKIVACGGEPFVSELAKLHFLLYLNIAHVQIMQRTEDPAVSALTFLMAQEALTRAGKSLEKDYWMKDFTYQPEDVHKAKYYYRLALSARLYQGRNTAVVALVWIEEAFRLLPADAAILREKERILVWMERDYPDSE